MSAPRMLNVLSAMFLEDFMIEKEFFDRREKIVRLLMKPDEPIEYYGQSNGSYGRSNDEAGPDEGRIPLPYSKSQDLETFGQVDENLLIGLIDPPLG